MDEPLHTVAYGARCSRSHGSDMVSEDRERRARDKRERERERELKIERRARDKRERERERERIKDREKRERNERERREIEKGEHEYPVLYTVWSIVGRAHCTSTVCV